MTGPVDCPPGQPARLDPGTTSLLVRQPYTRSVCGPPGGIKIAARSCGGRSTRGLACVFADDSEPRGDWNARAFQPDIHGLSL